MSKVQTWLKTEKLLLIEGWAKDGLTNKQIAGNIGISESTLYTWTGKYSVIADTLKSGKEVVDRQVENALLKRALGYTCKETITQHSEKSGVIVKEIEKDVPPDTTAIIYWLKNRRPDKWRDKQEVGLNGIVGGVTSGELATMTKEEIKELTTITYQWLNESEVK